MKTIEDIREDLEWAEQELRWAEADRTLHARELERANAAVAKYQAEVDGLRRELIVAEGEPT